MNKIIFLFLLGWLFCACQDEDNILDVLISRDGISFQPISGGAIMYYNLPPNDNVFAINVRYQNAQGKSVIKSGSYACDSLVLDGFNEARQGVKAQVFLCDHNNVESEAVEVTFNTEDSGPVAFFHKVQVRPSWDGFWVAYDVPETARGMAHVFYVGEDPQTHEPDTLLVKSFTFSGGTDTLVYTLKQEAPRNTVVIRTEDFKGYMVKEQVWENVESYNVAKYDSEIIEFIDPMNLSKEDPEALLGAQYLFDGDLKGESGFYMSQNEKFMTFLAGPNAVGKPFILDLKVEQYIAQLRFYGILNFRKVPSQTQYKYGSIWKGVYHSKTPCKVRVYVSNDIDDENSWKEFGRFNQDKNVDKELRWDKRCIGGHYTTSLSTLDEVKAADPAYFSVDFPATGETFRYVKIVVEDTYAAMTSYYDQNPNEYVTFHEIEVYTKKD